MITRLLHQVIQQGTNAQLPGHQHRRVVYSNIIYVTLPIVYSAFVLIDIKTYLVPVHRLEWDQFIFVGEILICLLGIYLNRLGLFTLGRLIFLITWPALLHLIPIWHQNTPTDYYLAFPIGIIFHAVLIQLMFSVRYEPVIFWLLLASNFILLIFSADLMLLFAGNPDPAIATMVSGNAYYLLDEILYWLLFSVVIFLLVRFVENLFDDVNQKQQTIEEQHEELATVNEELKQANDSLVALNNKIADWNENLELIIAKRTQEVEAQSARLKEIAHYNAHKLRGPYCRIKGLILLGELITDKQESLLIKQLLLKCLDEFEAVVQEIQEMTD